jgi:uncharacterized tellurite resistance protein B-like protein
VIAHPALWHDAGVTSLPPGGKARAAIEQLEATIRAQLPGADATRVETVVALCGLVASVAYIDRTYADAERPHVRRALALIAGLTAPGVEAIGQALEAHMSTIATLDPRPHASVLRDHLNVTLHRELLDVLADLAAADDALTLIESDSLRRTADALGLTNEEFQAALERHKDKRKRLG